MQHATCKFYSNRVFSFFSDFLNYNLQIITQFYCKIVAKYGSEKTEIQRFGVGNCICSKKRRKARQPCYDRQDWYHIQPTEWAEELNHLTVKCICNYQLFGLLRVSWMSPEPLNFFDRSLSQCPHRFVGTTLWPGKSMGIRKRLETVVYGDSLELERGK